jgi:LmbE family N-acetylglucosaminyl deacetylase
VKVLAMSAHPDDETLGCGGTLLKHRAAGDEISWLIATQGHEPQWTAEVLRRKAAEVENVARAYGVKKIFRLEKPAARLETVPQAELMDMIRRAVEESRPEVVYLVHRGDVHSDHRALFSAAAAVLKPFHMARLGVRRILSWETLSSTDAAAPAPADAFVPNVFIDISRHLDEKLRVMALYETEAQPDPLPRGPSALRALSRVRGAAVGVAAAEAFALVRELA